MSVLPASLENAASFRNETVPFTHSDDAPAGS
jgi:hypothetical protein